VTNAITLAQAAAYVADSTGCRRPHINTVYRWATKGVRGQRLHTFRIGRTHWTTRGDIADFLARINGSAPTPAAAEVIQRQAADHARQVCEHLARKLGVPVEEFA
jgi:hypothetical protein